MLFTEYHLLLDKVHIALLRHLIGTLPDDARIALCCAGKFLHANWRNLQDVLTKRNVVAILDDDSAKLATGTVLGLPVRPIDSAGGDHLDAVLITSDRMEDRMVRRLERLASEGVKVIRTFRIDHNRDVTPDVIQAVVTQAAPDLYDEPQPWNEPLPASPPAVGVEINNGCNINCVMCETHSADRPIGEMEPDMFRKSLDQLEAVNCKTLTYHTVGEPTIHHRFADILRISHERGFEVMLSTNGLLIHRYIDALVQWPVAVIRFSVDGATRETYERIRVGGKFDRLLDNLGLIRDAIIEHKLPTSVEMGVTLSLDNLREVPLFFEVFGRFVDDGLITFGLLNSLTAGDVDYYEGARLINVDRLNVPCLPLWSNMYVGYDGRASACCRDYHGELVVGDTRTQTLTEIWNGPVLTELRAKHAAGDVAALPQACRNCHTAGSAPAALISYYITSLRRAEPHLSPLDFEQRMLGFISTLGPASPHGGNRNGPGDAGERSYPLPVLN